jgi:hypothetical protein
MLHHSAFNVRIPNSLMSLSAWAFKFVPTVTKKKVCTLFLLSQFSPYFEHVLLTYHLINSFQTNIFDCRKYSCFYNNSKEYYISDTSQRFTTTFLSFLFCVENCICSILHWYSIYLGVIIFTTYFVSFGNHNNYILTNFI